MHVKGNSSKNSVRTCLTRNQRGRWYMVKQLRRPAFARSSVDSESFLLYLKPYVALRRLSIKQSLEQDIPRSSGESGGSSGA